MPADSASHQSAGAGSSFADIDWRGRPVRIEVQWLAGRSEDAPLLVFLHEGLGSLAMWKDFPQQVCKATGLRGLVYSRPGYGRSTPRAADEQWGPDFMHQQAHEVLPALLAALGVPTDQRLWLLGHSDGASIALLYAARFPQRVQAAIVMAPHTFVEPMCIAAIAQARDAYQTTGLRERLGRYHADPDSAFWGWNGIWLHPAFRSWNIDAEVARIDCPLLAVQGEQDEYGTLEQVERLARNTPRTRVLALPRCGHSPHRDQPALLLAALAEFCAQPGR